MHVPVLRDLAAFASVAFLLLAAAVAPAPAAPPSGGRLPVTDLRIEIDSTTGSEKVEILMANLVQQEVQAFLDSLASSGDTRRTPIRNVEVLNVYAPDAGGVVHQRSEVELEFNGGVRQRYRLEPGEGRLLPSPRELVERELSTPPTFALEGPGNGGAVEVEVHREASVAYESSGYRASWFGEG